MVSKYKNSNENSDLRLFWSKRVSLAARILAVNIFVLLLMIFGLFVLDNFRTSLFEERLKTSKIRLDSIAEILTTIPNEKRAQYLVRIGKKNDSRLRLYDENGHKVIDNFLIAEPNYILRDPDQEPFEKIIARYLDYSFDFLVSEPNIGVFKEPDNDVLSSWGKAKNVTPSNPYSNIMNADDLSPVVMTIAKTSDNNNTLIETVNAHDLRIQIRAERARIFIFFLVVLCISILLSLFLARTIVRPIRDLAVSAVKVRLGRASQVTIPRLPERRDEIGMLARALSDMSQTLRQRIDHTQSFADDVAHEIKNPLASLRSALEGLQNIKDPKLSEKLMKIAQNDVHRMDRLITDIAEAGRVDSQISRAQFEEINFTHLLKNIIQKYRLKFNNQNNIIFEQNEDDDIVILGEQIRIERVIENLIDNAVSFTQAKQEILIKLVHSHDKIIFNIIDDGPGIEASHYEKIFQRFYSSRPQEENFGEHSGLGLAISRSIIEAHNGELFARQRPDKKSGACFEIQLPKLKSDE